MSLIHEALKKAEQQRHLGEAPTLNSPLFTRRRRRRWLLPLVVLVVIVAGSYLAWNLWPAGGINTRSADKGVPTQSAAPTTARAEQVREKLGTVPPYAHVVVPAAADAGAKPSTPQPSALAKVAPPSVQPAKPKATTTATAKPAAKTATKAAPVAAAEAATPPSKASVPPASVNTAPPAKPITPLPKQPASPVHQAQAGQPAAASTSSLPLYWQLPYAERKDLPELKISMHVFAADPADRFVILNGERQIEGDDLGNGLTLVEIRRDGIVVEMNGKRFIVPNATGH